MTIEWESCSPRGVSVFVGEVTMCIPGREGMSRGIQYSKDEKEYVGD